MVPSIGRVLHYHFRNVDAAGIEVDATRPAIVVDVDRVTNACVLHVFFAAQDGDRTHAPFERTESKYTPTRIENDDEVKYRLFADNGYELTCPITSELDKALARRNLPPRRYVALPPTAIRTYRVEPERVGVMPHFEGGEIGIIERRTPQPNTWSWPPRV